MVSLVSPIIIALFLLLAASAGRAGELHEVYTSTAVMAAGGAYIARTENYESLYLNPAGLAGNDETAIYYGNLDVSASFDILDVQGVSGLDASAINALMGKDIFARIQATPTLVLPGIAVGGLADGQFALYAKNKALPQLTLGYQMTNGFIGGFGFSLDGKRRRKKQDFRIGIALKWLNRKGGYYLVPVNSLFTINEQGKSFVSDLVGQYQMGYGADVGVQYVSQFSQKVRAGVGAVYHDVGGTDFGSGKARRIIGDLGVGGMVRYATELMDITTAYDLHHIQDDTDWRKKTHFGLELAFPLIRAYGGVNQGYLTYGAGIDMWLFKIFVASYGEELGEEVRQDGNRRYSLRLDLSFAL